MNGHAKVPATTCRGAPLTLLRLVWAAVTAASLSLAAASFATLFFDRSPRVLLGLGVFRVKPEIAARLGQLGFDGELVAYADLAVRLTAILTFFAIAIVVFVRKSDDWMTGLVSLMLASVGTSFFAPVELVATPGSLFEPIAAAIGLADPRSPDFGRSVAGFTILLFLFVFPDGRFVPRPGGWIVGTVVMQIFLWGLFPGSAFDVSRWPEAVELAWVIGLPLGGFAAQIYRYNYVSGPLHRQQTKLVVSALLVLAVVPGLLLAVSPELGGGLPALTLVTPRVEALYELILLFILALAFFTLPVALGVSVLRYRLWDLDLFINRALVYTAVTTSLGVAYIAIVVLMQQLLPITKDSNVAVAASTLAVAALFRPVRDKVQQGIDLRFNRSRYDAERTLARFSTKLRDEVDLDVLTSDLLSVVYETMQPEHVSLWLKTTEGEVLEARTT